MLSKRRYLFMTQRYVFVGTLVEQTPTHATLGDDAIVCYEDVGPLEGWSSGTTTKSAKYGKVPGQVVCLLGCDITPVP
jgi:hypothetical protein